MLEITKVTSQGIKIGSHVHLLPTDSKTLDKMGDPLVVWDVLITNTIKNTS